MDNKMQLKNTTGIIGSVSIFSGIPKSLYNPEVLNKFERDGFSKHFNNLGPRYVQKNLVVSNGKKLIANQMFREPTTNQNICFSRMAIGDGGFDFSGQNRVFPKISDVSLFRQLGQVQNITSFSDVFGSDSEGWSKTLSVTFFSRNLSQNEFSTSNQESFFVNEAGIFSNTGVMVAHVSFTNFPFDPIFDIALTLSWTLTAV